jgi:hypothetical protein
LLLSDAVRVAVWAELTVDAVAVKRALVAPETTVTDAGTFTALLLLARFTMNPSPLAASVRVTVQASVPAPVSDPLLQVNPLNSSRDPPPLR